MADNKESKTVTEQTEAASNDALMERLAEIETNLQGTIERQNEVIEKQNKTIEDLKNQPKSETVNDVDEGILVDRQSAHTMRLPVVNGAPVIDGKLERVIGVAGLEYLMNVKTADGKKYKFPFGCDISKIDFSSDKMEGVETISYENVETKDFKLQDIDQNDLTGASKIEKGKIQSEGNTIPEVDRSSGRPVMTGRKIRTVVRQDVRYYTIEHDGKKVKISSQDLGKFRI